MLTNAKAEYEPLPPLPFTLRGSQSTYCTEMENTAWDESEDEGEDTTDTGNDTDQIFDSDDKDEFDPRIDGDDIYADENMDWE
jgi:hypothetical protein